ncbi:MAG: sulfurtransferase-like selenium metabolism protein YedF [Chloroflexi bacterium]|nr:sulfurtransferase-like selenium metabolism protein YedF [Chloroflexota bacterium]
MARVIDARALSCPQPVVLTMKALEETDEVVTIVDNEAARDNVSRLGQHQGCRVTIDHKPDGIYLTLTKAGAMPLAKERPPASSTVLFIASEFLGRGEDQQLGSLLMQKFLHSLSSLKQGPQTIILLNAGVRLATTDSLVVAELQRLQEQGVEILACGTCLTQLQLLDKVAVGQVSDMYTIADKLFRADKIVPL